MTGTNPDNTPERRITRREFVRTAALMVAGVTATAALAACGDKTPEGPPVTPEAPGSTATPVPTAIATATPPPIVETIYTQAEGRKQDWEMLWPKTPQDTAGKLGGSPEQWKLNPDWAGKAVLNIYNIEYKTYEWRPSDPNNLPFYWPRTPQEALDYFFPDKRDGPQKIDPKFMQVAWVDPATGLPTGWHLSEDHWLVSGGPADLTVNLHAGEVAEGYTVKGSQDPKLFRSWLVFGGFPCIQQEGPLKITELSLQSGQGMTIWMPGTDPNKIGLEMEPFNQAKTPHYRGPGGEQLGPDSFGFLPVYPAANLVNK